MKVKERPKIWATLSHKMDTGRYESTSIEVGMSMEYDSEKDNPNEQLESLTDDLEKILKKKAKRLNKKFKKKRQNE